MSLSPTRGLGGRLRGLSRPPARTLGKEIINNGGFDSATGWTVLGTSTISGGTLNSGAASSGAYLVRQDNAAAFKIGSTYEITFTIVSITGSVSTNIGNASGTGRGAPGTYTERLTFTAGTAAFLIQQRGASLTSAVIDNVSVREYAVTPL